MYTCEDSGGMQIEWEKVCNGMRDCTAGDDETHTACEDSVGMKDEPSEDCSSAIFGELKPQIPGYWKNPRLTNKLKRKLKLYDNKLSIINIIDTQNTQIMIFCKFLSF